MNYFKTIVIVSGGIGALCLLALPLWIMGVPGIEGRYADGWKMGLTVLLVYPLAWLLDFGFYFVAHSRVGDETRARLQTLVGAIAVALFVFAIARLIQAFKTMP